MRRPRSGALFFALSMLAYFFISIPAAGAEPVRNAAEVYMEAFNNLSSNQIPSDPIEMSEFLPVIALGTLPPAGTVWPKEVSEATEKYLELNKKSLALLHEAASIERCDWGIDFRWSQDIKDESERDKSVKFASSIRQASRLLELQSEDFARKGKTEQAIQSFKDAFALTGKLHSLKTTNGDLNLAVCEEMMTLGALRYILNSEEVPARELEAIEKILRSAEEAATITEEKGAQPVDLKNANSSWRVRINLGRVAVAVERFHAEHGKLPANLDALVPKYLQAVPMDSFGSGPLHYRITEKGYMIYSVGLDGIDDGGIVGGKVKDITFLVERARKEN